MTRNLLRLAACLALAPSACLNLKDMNGAKNSGSGTSDSGMTDTDTEGMSSASASATGTSTSGASTSGTSTASTTGTSAGTGATAGTGGGMSCDGMLPPFVTDECILSISRVSELLSGKTFPCVALKQALKETAKHSTAGVGLPTLLRGFLVYKALGQAILTLPGMEPGPLRAEQEPNELTALMEGLADVESAFPCGDGPNGYTICTPGDPAFPTAAPIFFLAGIMEEPIDPASESWLLEYSFVMDADGDTSNNYVPDPAFPNDFFQDTDRWYVARWDGSTWKLDVSTAIDSTIKPASSTARVIISGNTAILIATMDEFDAACPRWRVTTFAHTGDYGLNPPNDWGGALEPPVDKGLNDCTF